MIKKFLFRCLVSKLFDVCPRSTVDEINQQSEVQIKWGSGIAGHVAQSGEVINIPDAYQVIKNKLKFYNYLLSFQQIEKFIIVKSL